MSGIDPALVGKQKLELVPIKSGWKTSEFWITMGINVTAIVLMASHLLEPKVGAVVMGIVSSIYGMLRTMVKR